MAVTAASAAVNNHWANCENRGVFFFPLCLLTISAEESYWFVFFNPFNTLLSSLDEHITFGLKGFLLYSI